MQSLYKPISILFLIGWGCPNLSIPKPRKSRTLRYTTGLLPCALPALLSVRPLPVAAPVVRVQGLEVGQIGKPKLKALEEVEG